MVDYLSKKWNDFSVFYTDEINGGGLTFADDYLDLLKNLQAPTTYNRVFEWCSGPAFIGYSLLANNIAKSLCLSDCYAPAVAAAKHTANFNNVENCVSIYEGDGIMTLPDNEIFDLVVGNPPHFIDRNMAEYSNKMGTRIYVDADWRLHKQFFSHIKNHLTRDGIIILFENSFGCHLETFRDMIESAGLRISGWQWSRLHGDMFWYLFIQRQDTTKPLHIG